MVVTTNGNTALPRDPVLPSKVKRKSEKLFLRDLRVMHSESFYNPKAKMAVAKKKKDKFKKLDEDAFSFHSELHKRFEDFGNEEYDDNHIPLKQVVDEHEHDEEVERTAKPHLRPRSMTERVAHLLQHAHATGKVGDLTKSSMGNIAEDAEESEEENNIHDDEEWEGMTKWETRRKVKYNGAYYFVFSEKRECLNMRQAEAEQRSKRDKFWGLIKCKEEENDNNASMAAEDALSTALRQAEKTALQHQKWKELDRQKKANYELARAKKEEKARKEYMKLFLTATDSSEIICHAWSTRPTVIFKNRPNPGENPVKSLSLPGFNGHLPGVLDDTHGFNLAASPTVLPPTFHATTSKARGKRVVPLPARKEHFKQDPFERFSAHKVRAGTLPSSASTPALGVSQRPSLEARMDDVANTYMSATPPRSSISANRSARDPSLVNATTAHAVMDHQVYEVSMGLFQGVTVPGGGHRKSVVEPVVPKTDKQLEKENLMEAYNFVGADEEIVEALTNNKDFRRALMGTIVWPLIKSRRSADVVVEKGFAQEGRMSFTTFYSFCESLYTETLDPSSLRRMGQRYESNGRLRKLLETYKVGDTVEGRSRGGPFWLPATVTEVLVDDGTGGRSYVVNYMVVSAWRKMKSTGIGDGDGVDIFSSTLGSDSVADGKQLMLSETAAMELESESVGESSVPPMELSVDEDGMPKPPSESKIMNHASSSTAKPVFQVVDDERGVIGVVYDALKIASGAKGDADKHDIIDAIQNAVMQCDDSEEHLKTEHEEGSLQSFAVMSQTEKIPNLRRMVNKSAALLALVDMPEIRSAFEAVNESYEGTGMKLKGSDKISKEAFVEFVLYTSDLLRYNAIQL